MAIRCRSEGRVAGRSDGRAERRGWRAGLVFGLALGLGAVVAGCTPERQQALPPVGAQRMALEGAACVAQGGQWLGGQGARTCVLRTGDGGKPCQSGADCEGACLARSQSCAPARPLLGCNEIVLESGLRVSECVE